MNSSKDILKEINDIAPDGVLPPYEDRNDAYDIGLYGAYISVLPIVEKLENEVIELKQLLEKCDTINHIFYGRGICDECVDLYKRQSDRLKSIISEIAKIKYKKKHDKESEK